MFALTPQLSGFGRSGPRCSCDHPLEVADPPTQPQLYSAAAALAARPHALTPPPCSKSLTSHFFFPATSTYFPVLLETPSEGFGEFSPNPCSTHDLDCRNWKLYGVQAHVRSVMAGLRAEVTDDGADAHRNPWACEVRYDWHLHTFDLQVTGFCRPTRRRALSCTHFTRLRYYILAPWQQPTVDAHSSASAIWHRLIALIPQQAIILSYLLTCS